jgi:hypothetical protein
MDIFVYLEALVITYTLLLLGRLTVRNIRGKEVFSFCADSSLSEN